MDVHWSLLSMFLYQLKIKHKIYIFNQSEIFQRSLSVTHNRPLEKAAWKSNKLPAILFPELLLLLAAVLRWKRSHAWSTGTSILFLCASSSWRTNIIVHTHTHTRRSKKKKEKLLPTTQCNYARLEPGPGKIYDHAAVTNGRVKERTDWQDRGWMDGF